MNVRDTRRNGEEMLEKRAFDRREFIALGVGALVVGTLPLASLRRSQQLFRRTIPVMGTIAEIAVVHRDSWVAQAAIDDAIESMRATESRLSRFRPDSEIGSVNRLAGFESLPVSRETVEVVESALYWSRVTNGMFDPCLARASELWNIGSRTTPPSPGQTRRFAGRRLFETIDISSHNGMPVLGIGSSDAAIDLGGIAKGYGVDQAVSALRRHGIEHALVNAGGDLYALGESPSGRPWNVGLRSPADPGRIDRTLDVSDRAVATSGDYMQYFEFAGRRFHHLLDPRTGEPVTRTETSVTVIADTCMAADAGATAAFALNRSEAERVIRAAAPGSSVILIG